MYHQYIANICTRGISLCYQNIFHKFPLLFSPVKSYSNNSIKTIKFVQNQSTYQQNIMSSWYNIPKPNVIFVLGGPGAGKGTQCELICKVSINIFFN